MSGAEMLLAVLALGVGVLLAWACVPVVRVLMFASTLLVSALLFLPGSQLTKWAGREHVKEMEHLAAQTPWALSEWAHLLLFLWLAFLLWAGRADFRGWRGAGVLAVLAAAAELAQWLTAGREPKVADVGVNLLGIGLGIGLGALMRAAFCAEGGSGSGKG